MKHYKRTHHHEQPYNFYPATREQHEISDFVRVQCCCPFLLNSEELEIQPSLICFKKEKTAAAKLSFGNG